MFEWDEQRIRFMADAAERLNLYEPFADLVEAHVPAGAHICDAGCGLGYLSLALVRRGYAVTAVDVSAPALAVLRRNAEREGLRSIRILEGDVHQNPPEQAYDAMVFCFFATVEETLQLLKTQCSGQGLLFKKHWKTHRFDGKGEALGNYTYERTADALTARGIPFESAFFTPELGQPFRSREDAQAFLRLYGGNGESKSGATEPLIETGWADFPYLLSSKRPVGLIRIDVRDLA